MDRLVCGDVGFGKTEVAIRAAFKAVQDGKQVGGARAHHAAGPAALPDVLRPLRRAIPVRVEVLSRFLTPAQAQEGRSTALRTGEVDVVIGTHRLLSGDVEFKRLGLLVVDEEQRFGVSHKEAIKQLKADVDVLTLTATPIPRTLEMSLTGIRDLSLLNTPPADRQPILTYVGEYDERAVGEAIRRELLREGQVFYVHNRVRDIEQRGRAPARAGARGPGRRRPRPDGRGHARAGRRRLLGGRVRRARLHDDHRVGHRHADGQHARGRPGRPAWASASCTSSAAGSGGPASGPTPTCSSRPTAALTEEAYERLKTIGETTELGSGFRIAMRDLEIRGAGNLLGHGPVRPHRRGRLRPVLPDGQRGHRRAEGRRRSAEPAEIKIELPLPAHLPPDYVDRGRTCASTPTAASPRCSRRPTWTTSGPSGSTGTARCRTPAAALLEVAHLRAECVRTGVTEVSVTKSPAMSGARARWPGSHRSRSRSPSRCASPDCSRVRSTRTRRTSSCCRPSEVRRWPRIS